jgi:lipoate synthase
MSANRNTIKFNVGGRHFEVSHDLIDTHSETMLEKLVSDLWQEDPEQEVFIDRDGDIFAHVLNYLRYGR